MEIFSSLFSIFTSNFLVKEVFFSNVFFPQGNHRLNIMYASYIVYSKKIIYREQLKHCLSTFKICGVRICLSMWCTDWGFIKYNFSPTNIIFYFPSLLSSAGFSDTIRFPMESPACSWEKLKFIKIQLTLHRYTPAQSMLFLTLQRGGI